MPADGTVVLNELRRRIIAVVGKERCSKYVEEAMKWLRNESTLDDFDLQGQELTGVALHSEFLLKVSELLEISLGKQKKKRRCLIDEQASEKAVAVFAPTTSIRIFPTADYSLVPGVTEAVALSLSGFLPHREAITTRCLIQSWQYGLDEISAEVTEIISRHVRIVIAELLEAVLRLTRPTIGTTGGFVHSFGAERLNIAGPAVGTAFRCIAPAKDPITAEDVLDVLDLNESIVRHAPSLQKLIQRIEVCQPRMPVTRSSAPMPDSSNRFTPPPTKISKSEE